MINNTNPTKTLLVVCMSFIVWWCSFLWSQQNKPTWTSWTTTTLSTTPTQKIFALWDSLTAWYQLDIKDSYPSQLQELLREQWFNINVVNGWKSWDTSEDLKQRLNRSTQEIKSWDIVIITIGANDGMRNIPIDTITNNMKIIIESLQQKNVTIVIWWMQIPTNFDSQYRQQFSDIYPSLQKQYNIALIPFFLENVAWIPSLNLRDGIHPNKTGYAIIAHQVFLFLKNNMLISK
jgi:acyl-CoA thioesterase-1